MWLRRAWLFAIGCALMIAAGGALVMRFELLTPEPTLAPELYGHALGLHGLAAMCALIAALLAIPTLVVRSGRGSVVLGFVALALWAGAAAFLLGLELQGVQQWPGASQRGVLLVLAASLGAGAAQLGVSLPALVKPANRPELFVAAGVITGIAIVALPLVAGEVPTTVHWLFAITAVAAGLVVHHAMKGAPAFALLAMLPGLVLAWLATAVVHLVPFDLHVHDTPVMLVSLPVMGGAVFGALLVAMMRWRSPQRVLAQVAIALVTGGTIVTSVGFFLLGSRGLPRRYFAYLPEFQTMQIVVGVAAVVTAIGCVVAAEAFRCGTRGRRLDAMSGFRSDTDNRVV